MKVIAFKRTLQGTGASRRLRNAGQTPGILYGGQGGAQNITLDHNALFHALKKETFHSSILDLEIDGQSQRVLLRDFQMHAFKPLVLHADFQRIEEDKKIHMKVALHFKNGEISPAVKLHSGKITHVMNEIEISCLPKDLPEFITVDLATIDGSHSLHVSDLQLPEGVTALVRGGSKQTVAFVTIPPVQVEVAAPAADAKGKKKK